MREWTRERFRLAADAIILVSEIACGLPGCPPLETVVVFWIGVCVWLAIAVMIWIGDTE